MPQRSAAEVAFDTGEGLAKAGKRPEALAEFRKAVTLDPRFELAQEWCDTLEPRSNSNSGIGEEGGDAPARTTPPRFTAPWSVVLGGIFLCVAWELWSEPGRGSALPPQDHYDVLRIGGDATAEEVRKAFRDRSRETHPDKCGEDSVPSECGQAAQEAVALAAEVLSDPSRRRAFDLSYVAAGSEMFKGRNLWAMLNEKSRTLRAAGGVGLFGIAAVTMQAVYVAFPYSLRLAVVLILCKRAQIL